MAVRSRAQSPGLPSGHDRDMSPWDVPMSLRRLIPVNQMLALFARVAEGSPDPNALELVIQAIVQLDGSSDEERSTLTERLSSSKHTTHLWLLGQDPNAVGSCVEAVANNAFIHTLSLAGCVMDKQAVACLATAIKQAQGLQTLILTNVGLGVICPCAGLFNAIAVQDTLTVLDLKDNQLSRRDIDALCDLLDATQGLSALNLDGNHLSAAAIGEALGPALARNRSLAHVSLARNSLGDEGLDKLFSSIRHKSLQSLNVSYNEGGPTCLKALACPPFFDDHVDSEATPPEHEQAQDEAHPGEESLTAAEGDEFDDDDTASVTSFDLNVFFEPSSVGSPLPSLPEGGTIGILDLSGNLIGDEGAANLASAVADMHSLSELRLQACGLTWQGARAIAGVIAELPSLSTLSLERNNLGDGGVLVVCKALVENDTVRSLRLSQNGIGEKGAKVLAKTLARNSTLEDLRVDGNPLTELVVQRVSCPLRLVDVSFCELTRLSRTLCCVPTLETLVIDGNALVEPPASVCHQGLAAIVTYWKQNEPPEGPSSPTTTRPDRKEGGGCFLCAVRAATSSELARLFEAQRIHDSIIQVIQEHELDGETLLTMPEAQLDSLRLRLGPRLKLLSLIDEAQSHQHADSPATAAAAAAASASASDGGPQRFVVVAITIHDPFAAVDWTVLMCDRGAGRGATKLVLTFCYDGPEVLDAFVPAHTAASLKDCGKYARMFVESVVKRTQKKFPGLAVEGVEWQGEPGEALAAVAKSHKADTIVLQRPPISPFVRAWVGSVQGSLINSSSLNAVVIVLPDSTRYRVSKDTSLDNILVSIDPQRPAVQAFKWAVQTCKKQGQTLHAVQCMIDAHSEESLSQHASLIERLQRYLKKHHSPLQMKPHLVTGDCKRELIESCAIVEADLLIVGHQHLSSWQRLLVGSVSVALADSCPVPVAVVPVPN